MKMSLLHHWGSDFAATRGPGERGTRHPSRVTLLLKRGVSHAPVPLHCIIWGTRPFDDSYKNELHTHTHT